MADISIAGSEKPEGLQDYVVRSISRSILRGTLKPGERLSPGRLADELGVSHIPVREALAALQAMGHVEHVPRVGFFVAKLSFEDLEDIYYWRKVLEDEANARALPLLDSHDLRRMRRLTDQMLTAVKRADQARFVKLNRQFHFMPFSKVGSDRLLRFLTSLWDAATRYQSAMIHAQEPDPRIPEQHSALVEAYGSGDVELVNRLMAEHRDVTLSVMRQALLEEGGRADGEQGGD